MGQSQSDTYMGQSKSEIESKARSEQELSQGPSKRQRRNIPRVNYANQESDGIDCRIFQHLNWEKYGLVEVGVSSLDSGMSGLIALTDFNAGDVITGYEGKIIEPKEGELRDLSTHDSVIPESHRVIRGYRIPKHWSRLDVGDGGPSRLVNVGCMANDAQGGKYLFPDRKLTHINNATRESVDRECIKKRFLEINTNVGPGISKMNPQYLIADANIAKGKEILRSYGASYWKPMVA